MLHLGFNLSTQTRIYEDNTATIAVSNHERATKRIRHVGLRHFSIFHWFKNGEVTLGSMSNSKNPSDELTKHVGNILHSIHSDTLLGK